MRQFKVPGWRFPTRNHGNSQRAHLGRMLLCGGFGGNALPGVPDPRIRVWFRCRL